ncbi:MAG TPA: cytochrome c [Ilumatobacteraceae bacterium]|nr:cytochrome c [Ilumatobacteraceae bacterium]
MARAWWTLSLVLCCVAAGCSGNVAGGSIDGRRVYENACATCHGEAGTPPPSMKAQLGVKDLRAPEFRSRVDRALVARQVRHGSANKLMPAFAGALTDAQIDAVSAYVVEQLGTGPGKAR